MNWQVFPFFLPMIISLILSTAIFFYFFPRRQVRGASPLMCINLVMALWSLGYIFELISTKLEWKIIWDNTQMLTSLLALLFLLFVRQYTRRQEQISEYVLLLLAVLPFVSMFLAWTDDLHHLVRLNVRLDNSGAIPALLYEMGIWFWVDVIYSYSIFAAAVILLLHTLAKTSSRLEKAQIYTILAGAFIPAAGFLLILFDLTPDFMRDPSPILFSILDICLVVGIYRFRMFEVVPLARDYLVDHMQDGMVVLDKEMNVVDINQSGQSILGVSLKNIITKPINVLPGLNNQAVLTLLEKIRKKPEKEAAFEISLGKGSQKSYYILYLTYIQKDNADIAGFLILLRDITGFKNLESALRTSESKYRSVSDNANDGIAIIQKGIIKYSNPRMSEITGYRETQNVPVSNLLNPKDMFELLDKYHQIIEGKVQSIRFETNILHKSGRSMLVEINASQMSYEDEPAVLVFARDITERKRAELAEREEREMAESLRAAAAALSGTLDFDLVLDIMLEQIERVVPYDYGGIMLIEEGSARMVRARGYEKCCPEVNDKLLNNIRFKVDETPNIKWMVENETPMIIRHLNQYPGWIYTSEKLKSQSWIGAPIITQGVVKGFISLDKIEAGFFNEKHAERLAVFAGHAALALENSRLFAEAARARDAAEEAARVKSVFLANMSHEIRTPLNAVIGMTSLLLDTEPDDEKFEFIQTIRTSSESLLVIINDILDFTKIEAGKLDIYDQLFELSECLEEAIDLVAPAAAEKKLEIAYLVDESAPEFIRTDETRLRQVLINLLSNAIKFTDQGEVIVRVGCRKPDRSTDDLVMNFSVKDTGIGIPQNEIPGLFKVFHQIDASMTRKYSGTGLGLTICEQLCRLMGGSIWVESEGIPGKGSTFFFTIKARIGDKDGSRYQHPDQSILQGKKLLLIDAHPLIEQELRSNASAWGVQVQAAPSRIEALECLRSGEHFDAALLERWLAEMNGFELAEEIRKIYLNKELPLILLTMPDRSEKESYHKVFSAFLTKPIKKSQLYAALLKVMGGKDDALSDKIPDDGLNDAEISKKFPLRILVAEDNPVNQRVILRILEKLGYHADVAANGLEVLNALQNLKRKELPVYDLVFMDIQMPEMDGVETVRHIRSELQPAEQPYIVALTAHAMQGDREKYLASGMDDYLSKPLRIHQLQRILWSINNPEVQAERKKRELAQTIQPSIEPGRQTSAVQSAIDHEYMKTYWEGMQEDTNSILEEMYPEFKKESEKHMGIMQQALEEQNTQLLWRTAHSLKGACFPFGALHLAELCKDLETAGKENHLEGADNLLRKIEDEIQKLQEEMHLLLAG